VLQGRTQIIFWRADSNSKCNGQHRRHDEVSGGGKGRGQGL
jgi:hypothetical protein